MLRIVLALYPHALATSLALPMDVLQAAGQAASLESRGRPQLQFKLASMTDEPVATVGGLIVQPDIGLGEVAPCDMLLLPALWRNPQRVLHSQRAWLEILPGLAASGTTICCVGTASCFLAECGLLDGQAATTHWNYFEEFAERYPQPPQPCATHCTPFRVPLGTSLHAGTHFAPCPIPARNSPSR